MIFNMSTVFTMPKTGEVSHKNQTELNLTAMRERTVFKDLQQ